MVKEIAPHANDWEEKALFHGNIQEIGRRGFWESAPEAGGTNADIFYSLAFAEDFTVAWAVCAT